MAAEAVRDLDESHAERRRVQQVGITEAHQSLGALLDAGRPHDRQIARAAFVARGQEQERQAEEVVGVEVADKHRFDIGVRHSGLVQLLQHRRSAVEQVTPIEQEGAEGAPLGSEGITGTEEQQVDRCVFHDGSTVIPLRSI